MKSLVDLINWFFGLLSQKIKPPPVPLPQPEYIVVHYSKIFDIFDRKKIINCGPEDMWYHFPGDIELWLEWCYEARSQCPPYSDNTQENVGFDCDDFADFFPAWCKAKHQTNAVWEAWGDAPGGPHAWNIVWCSDGAWEIEPQTGEAWPLGTKRSYRVKIIK